MELHLCPMGSSDGGLLFLGGCKTTERRIARQKCLLTMSYEFLELLM